MTTRIVAPAKVDGVHTYGPLAIAFTGGVAEVEDLPLAVEQYMRGAGYQIDKPEPAAEAEEADESKDSEDGTSSAGAEADTQSAEPEPDPKRTRGK